jgi:hypothetical protein
MPDRILVTFHVYVIDELVSVSHPESHVQIRARIWEFRNRGLYLQLWSQDRCGNTYAQTNCEDHALSHSGQPYEISVGTVVERGH